MRFELEESIYRRASDTGGPKSPPPAVGTSLENTPDMVPETQPEQVPVLETSQQMEIEQLLSLDGAEVFSNLTAERRETGVDIYTRIQKMVMGTEEESNEHAEGDVVVEKKQDLAAPVFISVRAPYAGGKGAIGMGIMLSLKRDPKLKEWSKENNIDLQIYAMPISLYLLVAEENRPGFLDEIKQGTFKGSVYDEISHPHWEDIKRLATDAEEHNITTPGRKIKRIIIDEAQPSSYEEEEGKLVGNNMAGTAFYEGARRFGKNFLGIFVTSDSVIGEGAYGDRVAAQEGDTDFALRKLTIDGENGELVPVLGNLPEQELKEINTYYSLVTGKPGNRAKHDKAVTARMEELGIYEEDIVGEDSEIKRERVRKNRLRNYYTALRNRMGEAESRVIIADNNSLAIKQPHDYLPYFTDFLQKKYPQILRKYMPNYSRKIFGLSE